MPEEKFTRPVPSHRSGTKGMVRDHQAGNETVLRRRAFSRKHWTRGGPRENVPPDGVVSERAQVRRARSVDPDGGGKGGCGRSKGRAARVPPTADPAVRGLRFRLFGGARLATEGLLASSRLEGAATRGLSGMCRHTYALPSRASLRSHLSTPLLGFSAMPRLLRRFVILLRCFKATRP